MRVATSLVRLFAHGAPEWHLYLGRLVGCCLLLIGLLVFPHRDAFAHRPAYTLDDLALPQLHVDTLQGDPNRRVSRLYLFIRHAADAPYSGGASPSQLPCYKQSLYAQFNRCPALCHHPRRGAVLQP